MVESDNKPQDLLEEVAEKKRIEKSREKAREMLPDFKVMLGNLISAKVPTPEVKTIKVTDTDRDFHRIDSDFELLRHGLGRHKKLNTKLTATVPLEDGETSVVISASGYPEAGNADSAKGLDYEVDMVDLDRVLIIEGSEARVQSKKRETELFTSHTPIGVPLPSWPSWSYPVGVGDLLVYQKLIESLSRDGVTFNGSTPPIIKKDYSEIRAKIKLPEPTNSDEEQSSGDNSQK